MKRRLLFIYLALFVLFGFAATSDVVTTFALKWYLQKYTHKHFDAELSYDSFTKNNGTWVIENPRLFQQQNDIFHAEKITIQIGLFPLSRTINIDVNLITPTITLGEHYRKAIKMATNHTRHFRILHINPHIVVTEGSLNFQPDKNITPLSFSIDATLGSLSHGFALITPVHTSNEDAKLRAIISQEQNNPLHLDVSIENMPIGPLTELLRTYYQHVPSLGVQTGQASGQLQLEFPKKRLTEAKGDLTIKDFYGVHINEEYTVKAPEITIKLSSQGNKKGKSLVPTAGHVDVLGGASIVLAKDGIPFWSFENLSGSFSFENNEGGEFLLDGISSNSEKHYPLHLEGYLHFSDEQETTLSFKTSLKKENTPYNDLTAHASLRHLAEEWDLGELEINGFTHEEFNLIKHLLSGKYKKINDLHLTAGVFDTSIIVYLKDLQPSEIKFDKIQARNIAFSLDNWVLHAGASSITGSASLDLTAQVPILTLDADLNISNGTASLPGPRGHPWHFVNIESDFNVREGIIQQSSLQGSVAGMHAKITLDGTNPDSLVKVTLIGSTDNLTPYVSKSLKRNLERNFAHNQVRIEATGKAISSALDVKGLVTFSDEQHDDAPIHFSFAFERKGQTLSEEKPPHYIVSEYLTNASMEAIATLLPKSDVEVKKKKKKNPVDPAWNLFGYTIEEGRFEANDLCIDKYLSPFIFSDDEMKVCGVGAFYGIFNIHGIKVDYDASDLVLKNSDFAIEIKKICQQNEMCTQMVASHYFDFDEGKGYGILPVSGGSYFEKNSGLLFTDIDALIFLQHDRAHITELSTFCNGIHFMGNIEVDWSMPGNGIFEVDVHVAEMDGKVSQFQHFFSHFNKPFFFLKTPLEGNISLRNKGAHLFFAFVPNDFTIDCNVEGSISDGVVSSPGLDMRIQDVSMDFAYDHIRSVMDFSDLQATLLVGSPSHFEEYVIASDGIHITDYEKNESIFDIWVADKTRDIVRIVGKTHEDRSVNDETVIKVDIDKSQSHFGNMYPKNFELVLDSSTTPILFNIDFEFTLNSLLTDLQRFSRTGLLFLSRSMLKELNGIEQANGTLTGSINYLKSSSTLEYKFHGTGINIDNHQMEVFELIGNKRGDLWSVEQLQMDNISLSLDIHRDTTLWNINFLGARLGTSILLGMEGVYIPDEDRLKAKINLCEVDLAALKEWPFIAAYIDRTGIKGNLRTSGALEIAFDRTLPEFGQIDLHATGSLTKGQFNGYSFEDIRDVALDYDTTTGLMVKNIQTIIATSDNEEPRAGIYLKAVNYNHNAKAFDVNGLYFNVPAQQLGWLARHLESRYPDCFSPSAIDLIGNIKSTGAVQGSLSAAVSGEKMFFRVSLDDDTYHWMGSEYNLRNVVLDYDDHSLKFYSKYLLEKAMLNIAVTAIAPGYDRGQIVIAEVDPSVTMQYPSALTIYWNSAAPQGFSINKAQGHLCGITVDLANDIEFPLNPHYHHLVGTVSFDLTKASKLLSAEQSAAIATAQLGQGYAIHGRYALDKSGGKSFGDKIYFQGELSGSGFTCYGYRMSYLTAQLDYQPSQAIVTNLVVNDACGQMHIPTISLVADAEDHWHANIPEVTLKDLRPSAMESLTPSPKLQKSLTIRHMEINNIQGVLGNRDSFRGSGKMMFINPQKKNFQDTIFAIPADLLTRIGLDLGVLTPIRGNIEFDLSDSRIYLSKFKEVYSKKKVSKFQLAKTGYQSYIDLDGNVHVQIKMKQYNLVFKLAELFTVTIGGTISKPTYSLQKQPRDDNNG